MLVFGMVVFGLFTLQPSDRNWPQFRGPGSQGIQNSENPPPIHFNGETGHNIRWKTELEGLGHASPVVWGNRIFLTSAVSHIKEPYLRTGLYGASPDNPEQYEHRFRLICLDRNSGSLLWQRDAHAGIPQVARHVKSSHANSSPATNGQIVVAFFGSEGLYAYDIDGAFLWKRDLGLLDAGAFDIPEIQWGFGSSPVIYEDRVVVLCDVNNQSFVMTLDLTTGETLWKTERDEGPTWGTPVVTRVGKQTHIVVNGFRRIAAYDLIDGREIWHMRGGGDVPVPTPVIFDNKTFITNAHGPLNPIYAIDLKAEGDISLKKGQTSNAAVTWAHLKRGAYLPTPLAHRGLLYVGNDRGILTCYRAESGQQVYRERIGPRGEAYTASAVATDRHLYLTSEDGDVHVIALGPTFERVASNPVGGPCLATPAISGEMLIVRSSRFLLGVGATDQPLMASSADQTNETSDPTASSPTDDPALTILMQADQAMRGVSALSYRIEVRGEGPVSQRFKSLACTVAAYGAVNGLPERFKLKGIVQLPGMKDPRPVDAGCDGQRFYWLDHAGNSVHADLEARVFGSMYRLVSTAFMREYHMASPLEDEIKGRELQLMGSEDVNGTPCWKIRVRYDTDYFAEAIWYIGKNDALPRGRSDFFGEPDQRSMVQQQIHDLRVRVFDAGFFELKIPAGYKIYDSPVP